MYYSYPFKDVFAATQTVLKEQGYDTIEINPSEKMIKALRGSDIPGLSSSVTFSFREEGTGTWVNIIRKVPPQFVPGSTDHYRMDIDELYHYVEMELDRNY